jgi:7-cyano-7-deazaguanine synthase
LSGGIDSTALAYWKRPRIAVTVDYGQASANAESAAATKVARDLNVVHTVVNLNLRELGSGIMVDKAQPHVAPTVEWWPFRNQLLVTIAAMVAIQHECPQVWIATVSADRNRHLDGTPRFITALNRLLASQEGTIRLVAPAVRLNSQALVERAKLPANVLAWCHSCHTGPLACGTCPGCIKADETRRALHWI